MNAPSPGARPPSAVILTLTILATMSGPAWARPDPGGPTTAPTSQQPTYLHCPLERVTRQSVRCDNLTGADTPAPLTVPIRV